MQIEVSIVPILESKKITHLEQLELVSANLNKSGVLTLVLNEKPVLEQKTRPFNGGATSAEKVVPVVSEEECGWSCDCAGRCQRYGTYY